MPPLEAAIRREIAKQHGPAVEALRQFYRNHELADPGETLSRYVSYGLILGSPPRFRFIVDREAMPPDAAALDGLTPLLSAYYTQEQVAQLYARVLPIYERHADEAGHLLRELTQLETGYMRLIPEPSPEHTYTVYVEPLVGVRSNFRIYGGRYALVIDPTREGARDDIRHSLLHFLLDPLALSHHPPIAGRKAILDVASRAPRLPTEFRQDIVALTDECLVKAVELRIQHLTDAQAEQAVTAAEADGFVLIRPIYNGLRTYEKGEDSLKAYYPQLIQKIDLNAEARRLASFQFAAAEAAPAPEQAHVEAPRQEVSELERWLLEGESQLAQKDTRLARATFERVLEKYPDVPRAQYGLAVCIIVDGEVERGRALLEQVVAELSNPGAASQGTALGAEPAAGSDTVFHADPRTLAWAHVWLGRIYEQRGLREQAGVEYRAALAVEGVPEGARMAAQRGLGAGGSRQKSP